MTLSKLRLFLHVFLGLAIVFGQNLAENPNRHAMKMAEKAFLSSFGLKEKPKYNATNAKVPPYMLHLYNLQMTKNAREEYEENSNSIADFDPTLHANTVRSYVHNEKENDEESITHTMVLEFNVSQIPDNEIIRAVELRISYEAHASTSREFLENYFRQNEMDRKITKKDLKFLQRLRIYDILRPQVDENGPIHRLLDTTVIDSRLSGTVKFDVAPAVTRWLSNLKRNYGLYLEVVPLQKKLHSHYSHIRLKRSTTLRNGNKIEKPLLLIHSHDESILSRSKRDSKSMYKRYNKHCQRHNLRVDFRKVEWTNWIVAPAGYEAYYCQGECHFPLADHMNSTNHAVVQTLVHSKYPSRVPSACCVPTIHTAISMLYVDEDGRVVLKNYQDMVVEACGCR